MTLCVNLSKSRPVMKASKMPIPTTVHTPASAAVDGVALIPKRRATAMAPITTKPSPSPMSRIMPRSVMRLAGNIQIGSSILLPAKSARKRESRLQCQRRCASCVLLLFTDREEGREALIFCWFLLVNTWFYELYETRNQVHPCGDGGSNPSLSANTFPFVSKELPRFFGVH